MYGLSVLTWETGNNVGKYSTPIKNAILGKAAGHSSLRLTIPDNEKNNSLIENYNKGGNLKVRKIDINVTESYEENGEIKYRAKPEKALEVYFSFWGDPKTVASPELHRILDGNKDQLAEGEGKQWDISEALGGEVNKGDERVRKKIPTFRYLSDDGKDEEKAGLINEIWQKEKEKQEILSDVKKLSKLLKGKSKEDKEKILSGKEAQNIFKKHDVEDLDKLNEKLRNIGKEIEDIYNELEKNGVLFGEYPSSSVELPIDLGDMPGFLDYEQVLLKMCEIANKKLKYNALYQNCCDTAYECISAGVTPEVKDRMRHFNALKHEGEDVSKNWLATPQGIMLYASALQEDVLKTYMGISSKKTFMQMLMMAFSNFFSKYIYETKRFLRRKKVELQVALEEVCYNLEKCSSGKNNVLSESCKEELEGQRKEYETELEKVEGKLDIRLKVGNTLEETKDNSSGVSDVDNTQEEIEVGNDANVGGNFTGS